MPGVRAAVSREAVGVSSPYLRPRVCTDGQNVLPLLSARDRMAALARDGSSVPIGAATAPHIEEGGQ